jgi:iron-sulfur cluster repair protein YtfE (RIC family)
MSLCCGGNRTAEKAAGKTTSPIRPHFNQPQHTSTNPTHRFIHPRWLSLAR